jgi:hypothetical protein
MPSLITKLQFKNYEIGEFTDERERCLEEILGLIQSFPWLKETGSTDNQLTGPSVTVQNTHNEYLKISLNKYYDERYGMYLLTANDKVWVKFSKDVNEVKSVVTDFFANSLTTLSFKLRAGYGLAKHFHTSNFKYKRSPRRALSLNVFIILLFISIPTLMLMLPATKPAILFLSILELYIGFLLFKVLLAYIKFNNTTLIISKNNNEFYLQTGKKSIRYHKSQIKGILVHETYSRNPNGVKVFELIFIDGTVLRLNNLLIPTYQFLSKFPSIKFKHGKRHPLHMI